MYSSVLPSYDYDDTKTKGNTKKMGFDGFLDMLSEFKGS